MTQPTPMLSHRRICFVAPFGLGVKTTVWARTLPLARVLAARGHAVTLLIPPWDTPGDAGKRWVDQGVQVVNVAVSGGPLPTLIRLLQALRVAQPDLVHLVKPRAHAGLLQWLLWQGRRLQGGRHPCILLDVDDWEQAWAEVAGYPWPLARFLAWQEEWGIRHTDGVTAASRWLLDRVTAAAPGTPLQYLPNGVTIPAAAASPTEGPQSTDAPRILLFSRFVEVDPRWMAGMWRALQRWLPGVTLVVAGAALQPVHEERMQKALKAATLNPLDTLGPLLTRARLEWRGYVEPADLAALYASVDCAIFPADPVPLNQAKCSVRLATTLLHGVPVVASAVGEQAAYGAGGAARLVAAGATAPDFAAEVVKLLAAAPDRQELVARARQLLATTYRWEKLGHQLESFYAQLC